MMSGRNVASDFVLNDSFDRNLPSFPFQVEDMTAIRKHNDAVCKDLSIQIAKNLELEMR